MAVKFFSTIQSITPASKTSVVVKIPKPQDFTFEPGQYIWLRLLKLTHEDPRGNKRAFSLISTAQDHDSISLLIRKSDSGYKKSLLENISQEVEVEGPFGFFTFPKKSVAPIICIAGGTGVSPFLSLLKESTETSLDLDIRLHFFNHSQETTTCSELIKQYQEKNPRISTILKIGRPTITDFASDIKSYPSATWYISGPKEMVSSTREILLSQKVPLSSMMFDEFYFSDIDVLGDLDKTQANIFQLAIESSFNHVILTDSNGFIQFANSAAQKVTGYTLAEMKGNTPRLWGGLMSKEFYKKLWKTIKEDKKPFSGEVKNRRKDQGVYIVNAKISPILNDKNQVIGFIGTEEDITSLKISNAKLEKKVDELEFLNKVMIGREVKIAELKKEISQIKTKS